MSGRYELIQGDATKRATLPADVADLIVTSPPYNLGKDYSGDGVGDALPYADYLEFARCWLDNCLHWTKSTGRLCLNIGLDKNLNGKEPMYADILRVAMKCGWKYHATIIWRSGTVRGRTAWGSWKSASAPHIISPVETIAVMYKDAWKREHQGTSDIVADDFKEWVRGYWDFNGENAKHIGHEAPFPRELPRRCIGLLTFPGDTVLDPFAGSGTTIIEAIAQGRRAIGVEIEHRYCRLARDRIAQECHPDLLKPCRP